jgi:hemerythrin-like domain-containing protein
MFRSDRRSALSAFGSYAIVGAFGLSGCSRAGKDDMKDESEVTANEDLMREHGILRRILVIYREVSLRLLDETAIINISALADSANLFRQFGEHYHEQLLEEKHIFPIVRNAGGNGAGLVDALLVQHARGRSITDYILDHTKNGGIRSGDRKSLSQAMSAFARMYETHTAREDTIIFPSFKKAVGAKRYNELGDQFEDIERKEFGGDGFDMALDKITAIEDALGMSDLNAFTAPLPR